MMIPPRAISFTSTVELRSVWPREQQDFSQWLVNNIEFLNGHLPFHVDPDSLAVEQAAGDFIVDVIGDAITPGGESFKVVIENQLTETDHRHLGQVLTYIAAFGAKAAIWISAGARPEHARAIQWINDETSIEAWLFDVQVVTIDGSNPAPLLRQIVGPSILTGRVKRETQAPDASKQQKMDFWTTALPVVKDAAADSGLLGGREPTSNPYVSQKAEGPATAYWQAWVTSFGTWLCLRIQGQTKEETLHYFDQLEAQRGTVEAAFGGALQWLPLPDSVGSIIRWDNPEKGGFQGPEASWGSVGRTLGGALARLHQALAPAVESLREWEPPTEE